MLGTCQGVSQHFTYIKRFLTLESAKWVLLSETQRGYNITAHVILDPSLHLAFMVELIKTQSGHIFDARPWLSSVCSLVTFGPDINRSPSLLLYLDREFEVIYSLPLLKHFGLWRKSGNLATLWLLIVCDNKVATFWSREGSVACLLPCYASLPKHLSKSRVGLSSGVIVFRNPFLYPDLSW